MTKNETYLFDLLKGKGINVKDVYFQNNWSWHPNKGWFAVDEDGTEYFLGVNFEDAKGQIIKNEFKIVE